VTVARRETCQGLQSHTHQAKRLLWVSTPAPLFAGCECPFHIVKQTVQVLSPQPWYSSRRSRVVCA
jgi:hypothetical protein